MIVETEADEVQARAFMERVRYDALAERHARLVMACRRMLRSQDLGLMDGEWSAQVEEVRKLLADEEQSARECP